MTENPTVNDYDASDGWDDHNGCEQCPKCKATYSANGGYTGTVYEQDGTKYDHFADTDPMDGPFFCESCWTTLETNRKRKENATLGGFSE